MVKRLAIILIIAVFCAWQLSAAADKPYYKFPLVTDLHDAARVLVYDVFGSASGSRNITGSDINKPFRTYTGPLGRRIPVLQNLSGYARKSAFSQLSAAMQTKLLTKVSTTDPRLTDARTPLAHTQAISTVTGLQTALDGKQATGSYATSSTLGIYTGHQNKRDNPHLTVPAQIFSSHTGSRYPLFDASNAYTWQRPLEACVNIFDGATGSQGIQGVQGIQGIQGPPGQDATVTEAAVITTFGATTSDNALRLQATSSGSQTKIQINDSAAYPRIVMTSTGLLLIKDTAGNIRWGFDTSDYSMTLRRGGNIIYKTWSTGRTTFYRPNGTTPIMRIYTAGRVIF